MKTTIVFAAPLRWLGVALVLAGALATSCDEDTQTAEPQFSELQVDQDSVPYIGTWATPITTGW